MNPLIKSTIKLFFVFLFINLYELNSFAELPCAVLSEKNGTVQVLDPPREKAVDVTSSIPVECGSWVSVEKGWANLKHKSGVTFRVSAGSFLQLSSGEDQAVLFRGQMWIKSTTVSDPFSVLTANARARISNGESVLIFSQADQETQFISLKKSSTLENRFDSKTKIKITAGEATSLRLDEGRVLPSTPRTVTFASLKSKLDSFDLTQEQTSEVVALLKIRQERAIAKLPVSSVASSATTSNRAPASVDAGATHHSNEKMKRDPAAQKALERKWVGGGTDQPNSLLFPKSHKNPTDEIQKQKLINDINRIENP